MTSVSSLRILSGIAVLLSLTVSLSCKKGESNPVTPPGGGGSSGGTVSDSLRMIVLDSLTSKINQLPQIDRDADNLAVYQYVRTRPEFVESGVRSSGVWAIFQDGRFWAFVNNLYGTDTSWTRPTRAPDGISSPRRTFTPSEDLPQNNGARVMNALGTAFDYSGVGMLSFTDLANDIRSWLQQAGYTPVSSAPSVDELRSVSGDGVFYCSAHGETVKLRDSSWVYGMWTATQTSPAGDALYKADLDSGRLGYFTAPHIKGGLFSKDISETHYAITHKFVREYMSFGPRSVVFINGCLSGDQTFRDACVAKGADLYLGWSNYVEAHRAARIAHYYFDRALGADGARPTLSPPQKGYQLYDVFGHMYTTGRTFTTHPKFGRADLEPYPPAFSNVTMLRPLIYSVHASTDEFRILGWFGGNPGAGAATVQVGGTVVPIRFGSWTSASTVVCDPIQNAGDVVVSVRGRRSHPVPLTKFRGTFDYTLRGRGSLTKRVSVTFEFLADVRTNRVQVDEPPQWALPRLIFAINTTGGTFEASGEYRDAGGTLIETWAGSGSLSLLPPGSTSNGVTVSGLIDKTGFAQSFISVGVSAPYTVNGTASTFYIEYGVGSLLTQMDNSFVIPRDTYTGGSGTESATGTFSDVTSTFAPTDMTVR